MQNEVTARYWKWSIYLVEMWEQISSREQREKRKEKHVTFLKRKIVCW